jgi:hypothetical protein
MDDRLLPEQTPVEYFKGLIESALSRQHLRATELTSYYLVDLMCRFMRPDRRTPFHEDAAEPLALRLARALDSGGLEQRARLRNLGDFSLFMCGFFADNLNRRAAQVDYYVSMGEYAYGSLSRRDEDTFGEVFSELSRKFVPFMDVLAEVSERTNTAAPVDVLRLYERWLRTGSARDGQRLVDRGLVPDVSLGSKFLQ